jgi:hypothetical protein
VSNETESLQKKYEFRFPLHTDADGKFCETPRGQEDVINGKSDIHYRSNRSRGKDKRCYLMKEFLQKQRAETARDKVKKPLQSEVRL